MAHGDKSKGYNFWLIITSDNVSLTIDGKVPLYCCLSLFVTPHIINVITPNSAAKIR